MKNVDVVAGVIVQERLLLVCQRKESAAFPLKWEFPGGKVEPDEAHEDALRRELMEELGIKAGKLTEIFSHTHKYSDEFIVNLRFYRVHNFTGALTNRAFQDLAWTGIDEVSRFDFLDGDLPFVDLLVSASGRKFLA
ncbi:MAG TPA: (deoxy)nucleoside triphosphate pyrophosphohydrolase [Candidatus Binatia bacterium]|jgi:8-oxo-dGTP diphosphatase